MRKNDREKIRLKNHISYIRTRIKKAGKVSALSVTPDLMKRTKEVCAIWDLGSLFSWVVDPKSHHKSVITNEDLILVDESLVYRPQGKYPSSLHPLPLVFASAEEVEEYRSIVIYCSRKKRDTRCQFLFTPQEILMLLNKAGIRYSDIGLVNGYHLSRNNDEGDYRWGNAEFVPAEENRSIAQEVQGKKCRVGDEWFTSMAECCRSLGITDKRLRWRSKSPKYPDWEIL